MTRARSDRVVIFGAAGHIGGALARQLRYRAPDTPLRLITRREGQREALQSAFPNAQTALADYLDPDRLRAAVAGARAVFVVTPHFLDEAQAMGNLVAGLKADGAVEQVVRIVGWQPDARPAAVPEPLRAFGSGVATQHFVARDVLDASGLPTTYLNLGASMMDNFLRNTTLRTERLLVWPNRRAPYVDPREVAEAAARLILAPGDYLGRVLTLNNNHDLLSGEEVAALMQDVLLEPVAHDGGRESFLRMNAARMEQRFGRPGAAAYLFDYFEYERKVAAGWSLNDALERLLGRKPTTLRAWIQEHIAALFGTPK